MSILVALIIGGIVGWLAAAVTGRNEGIIGSIAIGVVGSIIGGILAALFNSGAGFLSFSWPSIIWSFIGAVILSVLLNIFQHRSGRNAYNR